MFGIIFNSHVMKKLGAPRLPNRRSGLVSLGTFATMVVSGYLLQVAASEAWLQALVVVHVASGAVFAIVYAAHLVVSAKLARIRPLPALPGKRRRRRRRRNRLLARIRPRPRRQRSRMTRAALRTVALPILVGCVALSADNTPQVLVSRDVYLMGTRARLSAYAETYDRGHALLESALEAIEATEEELSTWRQSSQLSALNRHPVGEAWTATPRVCRMFVDVWEWHRATRGAFDPAIGRLLAAWDVHGDGTVPTDDARLTGAWVIRSGAVGIRRQRLHGDTARRRRHRRGSLR